MTFHRGNITRQFRARWRWRDVYKSDFGNRVGGAVTRLPGPGFKQRFTK